LIGGQGPQSKHAFDFSSRKQEGPQSKQVRLLVGHVGTQPAPTSFRGGHIGPRRKHGAHASPQGDIAKGTSSPRGTRGVENLGQSPPRMRPASPGASPLMGRARGGDVATPRSGVAQRNFWSYVMHVHSRFVIFPSASPSAPWAPHGAHGAPTGPTGPPRGPRGPRGTRQAEQRSPFININLMPRNA